MIVLRGGPHDHCHFRWDEFAPPKTIRLPGPKRPSGAPTVAYYYITDRASGLWVYGRSRVKAERPPPVVEFIRYK